ncbi:MAG TPA: SNF2 helicase associated domain-containing protein, partial [Bacillaceae bacterium]
MNFKLNHKSIKDRCGTVSFRRGDSFYRAGKVTVTETGPNQWEATVSGTEDFRVKVEKEADGELHTSCSCPKLSSVKYDCQHIAAVLLAICEEQRQVPGTQGLADGLLELFGQMPARTMRRRLHFEDRELLEAEFTCKPVFAGNRHLLGMELKIGPAHVLYIRDFLEQLRTGRSCRLSIAFTYDPERHCFQREDDDVLERLIQVARDEKVYLEAMGDKSDVSHDILIIPPSSWDSLLPLLAEAPEVKVTYGNRTFRDLHMSDGPLPLAFAFEEVAAGGYRLRAQGMENLLVLEAYRSVLIEGKLYRLELEDSRRLAELAKLLNDSGTGFIPFPPEQLTPFLEKVVPGLRKLGEVELADSVTSQLEKTPLVAKLFLDRLKNRLVAGLEFHYGHLVINPIEERETPGAALVVRDIENEQEILQMMENSSFAKTDSGYFLHNEELEYHFLYHVLPQLQKLVQVYATSAVRTRIVRGNARPLIRVKVKKERINWLEFTFEMDGIPDKQVKELLKALEEKRKYYRLRDGSLMSLETKEFQDLHQFL